MKPSLKIGGREYPLSTAPNCMVCVHPNRFEIESQIVAGRVLSRIADDQSGTVTAQEIRQHMDREHMPPVGVL